MAQEDTKKDKPKFVIFVNNKELATNEHELTGGAIKELASVPNDYELFEVQGNHTVPVGNEQVVKIHNNQHFRAIPAGTFGLWQFLHD
jgi:Multiubiquitin